MFGCFVCSLGTTEGEIKNNAKGADRAETRYQ
jgi:hypothetical protein